MKKILPLTIWMMILITGQSFATDYYVDFDNGNDSNTGITTTTAWKHAPGDPQATGIPLSVNLNGGDRVLFKGGVIYRGQIKLKHSGAENNPIIYKGDGWGSEKAIIDGSEIVNEWTACTSAADAMGNPNWQNIYYAQIPESVPWSAVNLQEDGNFLWVAQEPDMPEPFFHDDYGKFFEVPSAQQTTTTLKDSNHFNQSNPNYWDNSALLLWTLPNTVVLREIKGYNPAQNQVIYDTIKNPSGYNRYSIYNSIHAIDKVGEYYCSIEIQNNQRRVYLWPRNTANLSNNKILYSKRAYGFNISSRNFITIEGFEVRKFSGDKLRDGIGIGSYSAASVDKTGITIRNNYIHHNSYSTRGYGGIYFSHCHDSLIENNEIRENIGQCGIFVSSSRNVIVQNNTSFKAGATSFKFYTCENIKVLHNTISEGRGTHGNGMTFYMNCKNVLVDGNKILNSNICLTFQDSSNLTFINNIFDGYDNTNYVSATWGGNTGYVNFINNIVVGSSNNYSFFISTRDTANYVVKNNIIDGGGGYASDNHTHNVYLSEAWNQPEMGEGEWLETNPDLIFEDLAHQDYRLKSDSIAIDKGVDNVSFMPSNQFPGYNFHLDFIKTNRPQGTAWDLGAYEYITSTIPQSPTGLKISK